MRIHSIFFIFINLATATEISNLNVECLQNGNIMTSFIYNSGGNPELIFRNAVAGDCSIDITSPFDESSKFSFIHSSNCSDHGLTTVSFDLLQIFEDDNQILSSHKFKTLCKGPSLLTETFQESVSTNFIISYHDNFIQFSASSVLPQNLSYVIDSCWQNDSLIFSDYDCRIQNYRVDF